MLSLASECLLSRTRLWVVALLGVGGIVPDAWASFAAAAAIADGPADEQEQLDEDFVSDEEGALEPVRDEVCPLEDDLADLAAAKVY